MVLDIGAILPTIKGIFQKGIWILFAICLAWTGYSIYALVQGHKIQKEIEAKNVQQKAEIAKMGSQILSLERQTAKVIVRIQTNTIILERSVSNLVEAQTDYSNATNSYDAVALYLRRHTISNDHK